MPVAFSSAPGKAIPKAWRRIERIMGANPRSFNFAKT
jgi:hypothetical protein